MISVLNSNKIHIRFELLEVLPFLRAQVKK